MPLLLFSSLERKFHIQSYVFITSSPLILQKDSADTAEAEEAAENQCSFQLKTVSSVLRQNSKTCIAMSHILPVVLGNSTSWWPSQHADQQNNEHEVLHISEISSDMIQQEHSTRLVQNDLMRNAAMKHCSRVEITSTCLKT